MRYVLAVLYVLASAPAMAGEITVKVSDQDQQNFGALPTAIDQCVAGVAMRGDAGACRQIVQFAAEFSAKVKAAAPPAEPAK